MTGPVPGHALQHEGRLIYDDDGNAPDRWWLLPKSMLNGRRAKCACGELSPKEASTGIAAKAWHRDHRRQVLEALEKAAGAGS